MATLGVKFDHTKIAPKPSKSSLKPNTTITSTTASATASATAGADAALAALQSSLAEENAKKQGNT
jgi:RNA polymerase II elongation factor ELL